jgi:hypothetical protein
MLKGFCFASFLVSLPFFSLVHTLHVFHLCFVPVLFSFVIFVVSLRVCLSSCSFFVVRLFCTVLNTGHKYEPIADTTDTAKTHEHTRKTPHTQIIQKQPTHERQRQLTQ